ncbi:hypothetical protein FJZ19_00645 [Candidatus Pacearchaeota archaeon]|nr:hypothetical protein [Candidatus Pacearchaeota archaeon]
MDEKRLKIAEKNFKNYLESGMINKIQFEDISISPRSPHSDEFGSLSSHTKLNSNPKTTKTIEINLQNSITENIFRIITEFMM